MTELRFLTVDGQIETPDANDTERIKATLEAALLFGLKEPGVVAHVQRCDLLQPDRLNLNAGNMVNMLLAPLHVKEALVKADEKMINMSVGMGALSFEVLRQRERVARIISAADKMERLLLDKHLADSLECVREYREALGEP